MPGIERSEVDGRTEVDAANAEQRVFALPPCREQGPLPR